MMGLLVDVGALALLLGLAWAGMRRGALEAGLRLAAIFVAYGAAVLAATGLGGPVARALALPPWAAMAGVGSLAFLVTYACVGLAARAAGKAERGRAPDGRPGPGSRRLGAAFGGLRAAVLLLPLLWLAHLVQGLGATGAAPTLPDLADARLPRLGSAMARVGVEALVHPEEPAQRMTARLLTEPGAAVGDVHAVLDQPSLVALRADGDFWADVEDGEIDRALARRSFTGAMHDASLRARLADLGLLDARAAEDPTLFREEMHRVLTEVGARLRQLRDDPALRDMMRDEELQRRLQEGDTLALLGDPRFRDLMGRLADEREAL